MSENVKGSLPNERKVYYIHKTTLNFLLITF